MFVGGKMSQEFKVYDYDIIYLSYDEPNAEENYYHLKQNIPWAKRVHGVEGSDAAHKACANIAETERFITIDGDNKVDPKFVNEVLQFADDVDLSKCVVSWSGYNMINGLTYGNGGIKCWPTDLVKTMRTHENADPNNPHAQVDFCWDLEYLQVDKTYSYVYNNATPHQAWRAGFREGVKMSLLEGIPASKDKFCEQVPKKNFDRLKIWCTAGADVKNGLWAIYGAREGLYKTMCTDWDHVNVRDFEHLNDLWNDKVQDESGLLEAIEDYGERLSVELDMPIPIDPLSKEQSKFFKGVYLPPQRTPQTFLTNKDTAEYDIVMISYKEPNAEENFDKLKRRFPRAKRVHGVKGIHQAHIEAAKLCTTDLIWIVDADADVLDSFNFDYKSPDKEKNYVKVWRSINPINNLEYGYGGVKLFPREATLNMDTTRADMTTSISRHFKPIKVVSNITAFNTDAYNAWKGAFRECAKLSSKVIDRQKEDETNERLKIWTTVGKDKPFGEYCINGARAGMEFGLSDGADLKLINDFNWLEQQFNNQTVDEDTLTASPEVSNNDIKDLLDRFELLYGGDIENVRRFYNDKDLSSIFKLTENEELRKAVVEKNLHSIFRLSNTDDDLRKAVLEQNLHSVFRLVGGEEDLRKAVLDNNLYSLARIMPEVSDEFKIVNNNDFYALWKVLEKYTNSSYIKPLKALYNDTTFDTDSFSRGQLESKKWLVDTVKDLNLILGNIFLCAGWYATVIPMLQDNEISFNNVRSFDLDPNVWKTAEIFNKALTSDGWKFKAQTLDIQLLKYDGFEFETIKSNGDIEVIKDSANTIINTSCEHIENFTDWYAKIPNGKLVILQSNNFFEVDEHVNCVNDIDEFKEMAPMTELHYMGSKDMTKYTRFMLIGIK